MAAVEKAESSWQPRGLFSRTPSFVRGHGSTTHAWNDLEMSGSESSLDDVVVDCGLYENGQRQPDTVSVTDALRRANTSSDGFVWIGLNAPTRQEFAGIAALFELPALAVEDAIRAHQRPMLEQYGAITFVVMKPVRHVDHEEVVEVSELAPFLGKHAERIYRLKREVLEFPRAVAPVADPMQRLADGRVPGVAKDAQPYFRDVYDHALRTSDAIEAYDKLLSDVLAADLAQVVVRQSEVAVRQNEACGRSPHGRRSPSCRRPSRASTA